MSKKRFIDQVRVDDPCSESWDEMVGNNTVRFCTHCAMSVNDLSEMKRKDALRLVRRSKGRLCIRYVQNPKTKAPVFAEELVQISRRAARLATGVMSASLSLASLAYAQGAAVAVRTENEVNVVQKGDELKDTKSAVLSGSVVDPAGAAIADAIVSIADGRGGSMRTVTDNEGQYKLEGLAAGDYSLSVEAPNFKPIADTIYVNAGSTTTRNDALEVGDIVETVEIKLESENINNVVSGGAIMVRAEYKQPLIKAVFEDDVDEVRRLLSAGEDANVREEDKTSPLFVAVEVGNREIVQLLLDFGAKVNVRDDSKLTPLMRLDSDATPDLVDLLIENGAKIDARDEEGKTALMHAAENANAEVLQALIQAGAAVNDKDEAGETPLIKAAYADDLEKVRALLLAGADADAKDDEDETAYDQTEVHEILEMLVSFGATRHIKPDEPGEEPAVEEPQDN